MKEIQMGNKELVKAEGIEIKMDKQPVVRDIPYGSYCMVNNALFTRIKSRQPDVFIEALNPNQKQKMRMYEVKTGLIHLYDPWHSCVPVRIKIEVSID
jgi:hypothetical protein